MKNKEKYIDQILNALVTGETCTFKEEMGIIFCDSNASCNKCNLKTLEWLEQEYIEHVNLTESEKVILENIDDGFEWIARDSSGNLYIYSNKPYKHKIEWLTSLRSKSFPYNKLFKFIRWEDKEPYNIKELLENENN